MATIYFLSCRDCGVDCDFETSADSVERVIELCADHGRQQHGMRSFTPSLYATMRQFIRESDARPDASTKPTQRHA
jgi:predicted small metal-binding protein